jgi:hypothetical protein
LENLKGREYLGKVGVDKIILKWILKNMVCQCATDSSGSRQEPVAESYEYGNEPSGSIKDGKFDQLSNY